MTPGVAALGREAVERIVKTIAVYDDFCHANDPHEEHDFGAFDADGVAGPERLELRDLLERQLTLLRRMRVRCETVSQQRTRLFSLLRGLWQQVSIAHDAALRDDAASSVVLGRMRDLLDEISAETRGHRSVLGG